MEDSRPATWEHIHEVQSIFAQVMTVLMYRSLTHDQSKLSKPEKLIFDEYTPKLRDCTYGSEEYKGFLAEMQIALKHHYSSNEHHPECHDDGIRGMTLIDLLEMLIDWTAATKRHADGDILKSIEINQKRFGYSDELKQVFLNTVEIFT